LRLVSGGKGFEFHNIQQFFWQQRSKKVDVTQLLQQGETMRDGSNSPASEPYVIHSTSEPINIKNPHAEGKLVAKNCCESIGLTLVDAKNKQ
jgi:hypothetical protein